MKKIFIALFALMALSCGRNAKLLWQIGEENGSSAEFALSPDGFNGYMEKDFGFEDRFFLVGHSDPAKDFPYALPGPRDRWGGTWGWGEQLCWFTHEINILFPLKKSGKARNCHLDVNYPKAKDFWASGFAGGGLPK